MELAKPTGATGSSDKGRGGKRPSEPDAGLVLSGNVIIGHQVAQLFSSTRGWQMQVVDRDKQAYGHISQGRMGTVVADIDTGDLGGLAFLVYAKRHWPSVITYAITNNEDAYIKQLACDMAGCDGFFHLSTGKLMLDMRSGMAAQLIRGVPEGGRTTGSEEGGDGRGHGLP